MTFILGGKLQRMCRACGCTENNACVTEITQEQAIDMGLPAMTRQVACCWVLFDIETPTGFCSACAVEVEWDQQAIASGWLPEIAELVKRMLLAGGREVAV